MGNNFSSLDKTICSAIGRDRGWLYRDLTDVHRRALSHVLKALGMIPLKPQHPECQRVHEVSPMTVFLRKRPQRDLQ